MTVPRARRGLVLTAVVLSAAALLIATGCGSGPAPPATPFGEPPTAAAGVHAWAAGEVGAVLFTADGGASWSRRPFFLPQRGVDVAFSDADSGWLITDAGTVLSTADGGSKWTVSEKVRLKLLAVAATDGAHAWVLGNAEGAAGEPGTSAVLRSSDGGASWKRTSFGDAQLADVAFADERHGWLVALDRIWSTRDGGSTWRLRRKLSMTVLTGVAFSDPRRAWVVGWGTQDGAPLVFATRDGGATWTRRPADLPAASPGALQPGQIACSGAESLWVTCASGILASADGGRTWQVQKVLAGVAPLGIAAADAHHVLATTNAQPILATSDGGATWRAYGKDGFLKQGLISITAVKAVAAQ